LIQYTKQKGKSIWESKKMKETNKANERK
jgi:hypothetical protein